jgi:hypothetical protein
MKDERFSQNNKRYFTLDYDNATETGLKPLIAAFKKAGDNIIEVVASNIKERKNGDLQKTAQFIFDNGQSVSIAIGELGDVAQTKLNSSIIPISDSGTIDAYAQGVSMAMSKNQVKFEKALARKAAAAIKDTSKVKPASRSIGVRVMEAKQALSAATSNLDAERKRLAEVNLNKNKNSEELDRLKLQLSAAKSEENALAEQISQLEETA